MAETHTVMPKKLAEALMEAGMRHYDGGGFIGDIQNALGARNNFDATVPAQQQMNQQYQQQQDVYGQQQNLAAQLLAQTQGQGPGQQLIAAQGAQNASNQAALMAGARGASANPGLVARNAALAGQQGNQQVLNAQAGLQLQSQNALANQQAQMANQALQSQSTLWGATTAGNNTNAQVSGQNSAGRAGIAGGLLGAVGGGVASAFGLAKGGEVPGYAVGGQINDQLGIENFAAPNLNLPAINMMPSQGSMGMGKSLGGLLGGGSGGAYDGTMMAGGAGDAITAGGAGAGAGGLGDLALLAASKGGQIPFGQMLAGGNVPGKAEVDGDSKNNDVVPTLLSPGEVVLPRSVTQSPDAAKKAQEFMAHLKKRRAK